MGTSPFFFFLKDYKPRQDTHFTVQEIHTDFNTKFAWHAQVPRFPGKPEINKTQVKFIRYLQKRSAQRKLTLLGGVAVAIRNNTNITTI